MRGHLILGVVVGLVGCGDDGADPDGGRTDGGLEDGGDAGAEDAGPAPGPRVSVEGGMLEGVTGGEGVHVFYGIPYAKPPIGDRRWRPPEPPEAWEGVRDATAPGVACPQIGGAFGDGSVDEDCLLLNVWTPELSPESPLPVMVWIHGGGFAVGSGHERLYEGSLLARSGPVVVVTINYRLGVLGYLAHASLSAEQGGRSGNYGFMDQQQALRWVRRNIGRFGGDADAITLFGESAGGLSVCAHLAAPSSHELFHRAISQSGICYVFMEDLTEGERLGEAAVESLGCAGDGDVPACLRAASVESLLDVPLSSGTPGGALFEEHALPYRMIVDGELFPESVHEAFEGGRIADVPFICGANSDEGNLFTIAFDSGVETEEHYTEAVARLWGPDNGAAIAAHYPAGDFDDPAAALSRVTTDGHFVCQARAAGRAAAAAGRAAWVYLFTQEPFGNGWPGIGAYHGAEILFVFGNGAPGFGRPGPQLPLSEATQRYWTRLASTGDPNGGDDPTWTAHDETDPYLELGDPIAPRTGLRAADCDFWDGIYAAGRR